MAKKYSSVRPKITSPPSKRDGDGNHIYNEILLDLPASRSLAAIQLMPSCSTST
jgi:hypothetical protein